MKTCLFGGAFVAAGLATAAVAGPVKSGQSALTVNSLENSRALLWNQAYTDGYGIVDQDFPDFGSFSTYVVDDFTTGGNPWNVNSVTTYYTRGIGLWDSSITTGRLQFYPKSGALPSDGADIAPEYLVPITLTFGSSAIAVTADTSGIAEMQGINGNYWVGLTPVAAFGTYLQEFHLTFVGDGGGGNGAASRNPGGGFGFPFGTGWGNQSPGRDMAYILEGDVVPAPAGLALLGLGGLVAGRRRR